MLRPAQHQRDALSCNVLELTKVSSRFPTLGSGIYDVSRGGEWFVSASLLVIGDLYHEEQHQCDIGSRVKRSPGLSSTALTLYVTFVQQVIVPVTKNRVMIQLRQL